MPLKYMCTALLLIPASLGFAQQNLAQQNLAQPTADKPSPEYPQYYEPPNPKCDAYTMKNRVSLNAREKTCYYRDQLISPSAISGAALFAGIAQAMNSPKEWPQGAKGYEWRASTRYVQGMTKSTGVYLVGLALHEDPRAVRPDCTLAPYKGAIITQEAAPRTFWQRLRGAVVVNFWAKDDNCNGRPAFAAAAGALSSGFVGMAWTPDSSNTITKALVRSGTALGGSIGNRVFSEFQGDITHVITKLGHKPGGGS